MADKQHAEGEDATKSSDEAESPLFREPLFRETHARARAGTPRDAVMLWGYLQSLDDKHWRLYLTPDLTEYVDFSKTAEGTGDYIHHMHLTGSPLAGTYVWVKRDAKLVHTVVRSAAQAADFLGGQIVDDFLAQTTTGIAPMQLPLLRRRLTIFSVAGAGSCTPDCGGSVQTPTNCPGDYTRNCPPQGSYLACV